MNSTLRRTWAEIDLDALAHNYRTLRKRIGPDVKFLGVVKADAYGHGAVQVSRTLEQLGADYLAVSSIDEAMELRSGGIIMPILILGHTPREQVGRLIEYHITQAVTCEAKALEYSEEAVRCGGTLTVHIKVDTGMSRLGYICDGAYFTTGAQGICRACALPGLQVEGIFTHFAVADEPDEDSVAYTRSQFDLFCRITEEVEKCRGERFAIRHCANTGAVACYPEMCLDMVRPGLLLYGYGEFAEKLALQPVMTLKSTISTIKIYAPGTSVSYGRIFTTDRTTRMGVVPYGYADGFFRYLSNRCQLMTADGPAPQRGKICMDMCMIDLTDLPNVLVGDEVEIFGKRNSLNEMAALAGTIPYELTCAVSKRVPRIYRQNGAVTERELLLRF
ncbi:MAG: alanine racemase [Clostridiales bacterium]|nr:alanine racemase [Candidatus Cacconaster stercorequi]